MLYVEQELCMACLTKIQWAGVKAQSSNMWLIHFSLTFQQLYAARQLSLKGQDKNNVIPR